MRTIAALTSLAPRDGSEHDQYGEAADDPQGQTPGDLDARQPPVLPQHGGDDG